MVRTGLAALDVLAVDDTFLEEEHRVLRATVRAVVETDIVPHADAWEQARRIPDALWQSLGARGLLSLTFPEALGGGGAGVRGAVVLGEELGRSTYGGVATSVTAHSDMSSMHLARAASAEQQVRWLPDVLAGRCITGLGVTEPEASSDLARLTVRARRDGDHYVLDGTKTFITHANTAGLFFVVARTGGSGRHGLSLFAVERDTPGLSNGRTFHKTGWRASDTGELVFDSARVPAENLLGAEGDGFRWMMAGLDHERIMMAAIATGLGQVALVHTLAWLRERPAYGGVLWDKQAVRHRVADQAVRLAAARTMLYQAAARIDAGAESRLLGSMLKAVVPPLVNEIAASCAQLSGGTGFVEEGPIERIFRDARFLAVGGGSTEVMLDEVARLL
ncbi:MAG TPA: acyl-CoA dehydrogenase family protein [Marmoricola sp.]|nr:acyl-CoA dehydrogenase family protein [Marmoricola sp.]